MDFKIFFIGCALWFGLAGGTALAESPKVHQVIIPQGAFEFTPEKLTIQPGDTVQWINQDTVEPHFLIDNFRTYPGIPPEIGSKTIDPGQTVEHTFMKPGEYPYQCFFHFQEHNMKGVIVVEGEASDPDPSF